MLTLFDVMVWRPAGLGPGCGLAGKHMGEPYGADKHGCLPDAREGRKLKGICPWLPEDHICLDCLM